MYNVPIYCLKKSGDNRPELVAVSEVIGLNEEPFYAEETADIMSEILCKQYVESVYVVCYDLARKINGIAQVSLGDINTSGVYKRIIGTYVLLIGASSFELYHNHPDGQLYASEDDENSYVSLKFLGEMIGVPFDDSIIITDEGWYSIKNKERGNFLWMED